MNAASRSRWTILTSVAAVLLAVAALVLVVTRLGTAGGESADVSRIVPATPPTPPRALPESGALVDAVVQADGTVRVAHWLRTRGAVNQLSLRTSGSLADPASVADLRVLTSQGQLVLDDPRVDSRPRVLSLVRPTLLVRLDYTLSGVTVRSPDAPGRALVGAVALVVGSAEEPERTVVRVRGQTVRTLACSRPDWVVVQQRPCGRPAAGDGWTVDLGGRAAEDVVTAQVDLDAAGS